MTFPRKQQWLTILAILTPLFLTACQQTETAEKLKGAFALPEDDSTNPGTEVNGVCSVERFEQPSAIITRKLDLLFVTDTSGSLLEERTAIADGIDSFIAQLPPEVDYRIAMMPAHGDTSRWSGRVYKRGSEPAVLRSDLQTNAEIRAQFRSKMTTNISDDETDGGEVGLYSLSKSLSGDKLTLNRTDGFYRNDAALAVIFVSDENDICADYPAGVTPVVDPQGAEVRAKAKYCGNISSVSVVNQLRSFQGDRPLVVGGIVYTDPSSVPRDGENEYGYGYMEAIQAANGLAVNLANGQFQAGLSSLGQLATIKLNLITEFKLKEPNIDPTTLKVYVDGEAVGFSFSADRNEVHLQNAGGARSVVDIGYCQKGPVIETDPDDPTNPTDPKDPTGPTDPSNPTDPTDPTTPTDPTDPTDPDAPVPWDVLGLDGTTTLNSLSVIWQTQSTPTTAILRVGLSPTDLSLRTINIPVADTYQFVSVTGLTADTIYYFQVTATDATGLSHVSNIVAKRTKLSP